MPQHEKPQWMSELSLAWTEVQPTVRLFIRSLVHDHQHVEDLTQQVALTVLEKFEEYDRHRSFEAWALGIARNKVMNHWTNQGRDRHIFDAAAVQRVADAHQRLRHSSEERRSALGQCMKKLSPADQEMLRQHYDKNESPPSLAQRLGATVNAIYIRLHRIRRNLLECIEMKLESPEARS